jgi:Ca-activated chloride channel family protein
VKTLSHQPKRDLFWWPLGAAIALLAMYHLGALLFPRLMLARQRQES